MTPGTYNLQVYAGDSLARTFTFRSGTESGALFDFTGSTARLTVRRPGDGTALLTLTHADGLVLGGTAGTIALTISPARTAALGEGKYRWAMQVTLSSGVARTYLVGTLLVKKSEVL